MSFSEQQTKEGVMTGITIEKHANRIAVLVLRGRFVGHNPVMMLHEAILDILRDGFNTVVLECEEVLEIDSECVVEVVLAHISVSGDGGRFSLVSVPTKMEYSLEISGFKELFNIFQTVEDATIA